MTYFSLTVIGAGILSACEVFIICCLATTEWLMNSNYEYGLWKVCSSYYQNGCMKIPDDGTAGSLKTVQAMVILGALTCLTAMVISLVYVLSRVACAKDFNVLTTICSVFATASAFFLLIGVVIYGVDFNGVKNDSTINYHLGFSFIMCCANIPLLLISAVMIKFGARQPAASGESQALLI